MADRGHNFELQVYVVVTPVPGALLVEAKNFLQPLAQAYAGSTRVIPLRSDALRSDREPRRTFYIDFGSEEEANEAVRRGDVELQLPEGRYTANARYHQKSTKALKAPAPEGPRQRDPPELQVYLLFDSALGPEALRTALQRFGKVTFVSLTCEQGFAFVSFETVTAVEAAVAEGRIEVTQGAWVSILQHNRAKAKRPDAANPGQRPGGDAVATNPGRPVSCAPRCLKPKRSSTAQSLRRPVPPVEGNAGRHVRRLARARHRGGRFACQDN